MMAGDGVVVYLGVYESADDAKADFADFKEAYKEGLIGLYDAGIVEKKPDGKIHVTKWEKPTQVGALAVLPWACSWESCSRPLSSEKPLSSGRPAVSSATSGRACPVQM